uniref:APO domain-containing protein n=1 Tax=Solanum lycopersicum TaxID=4081 RepID=A0A3Q7HBV7_SOLLC
MDYGIIDWAGSIDDMKSTSGYAFLFGSSICSWLSEKQSAVAQSTAEAEYVSASKATSQAIWLRRIFEDIETILVDGRTIHASNTLEDTTVHALRHLAQIMVVGKIRYGGSRNFIVLGCSMKKGTIDDVLSPIESYHMNDPSGTRIKQETELQQIITIICTREQKASQGTTDGEVFDSRKLQEDEVMEALKYVCRLIPHKYKPVIRLDIVLRENPSKRGICKIASIQKDLFQAQSYIKLASQDKIQSWDMVSFTYTQTCCKTSSVWLENNSISSLLTPGHRWIIILGWFKFYGIHLSEIDEVGHCSVGMLLNIENPRRWLVCNELYHVHQ